jgi:hypothetical protein
VNKHPHDEVIRAWLDGKQCQVHGGCEWLNLEPVSQMAQEGRFPTFSRAIPYKIKPATIRYRVALWRAGGDKPDVCVCQGNSISTAPTHPYFIRWLGDEQEVEV